MRTLYPFHGGIHLSGNKAQSTRCGIATAPLPSRLVIPFRQHAGEPAKPVVRVGERVLKGQLIGEPSGFVSSAIHAPTSGEIVAIGMHPVAHPSGLPDMCATLIPDGREEWVERAPADYRSSTLEELLRQLRLSGVVGLGGAAFPSDIKQRTGDGTAKHVVSTLILNGAECEPYITCDDMLMRERAAEIVQGAEILRYMLGAGEVLIGIEDNKPEAIAAMRQTVAGSGLPFEVVAVPTLYPTGGVKQLIRVLTGLEVPSGKLPTAIGVQCFNVATVYSAYRALAQNEPVISRIVTVTGNVRQPCNYEVLIGTPMRDLVALGEALPDTNRYIMGGPMMGMDLPSLDVPLVKACNCVIAVSDNLIPPPLPALPCIRCSRCAQVCPADLQPMDLFWFAQARNFDKAQEFSLFDCIECGACSYVCPSHIPLVQYYRYAKSEIRAHAHDKKTADKARIRFEFREFRIERDKREKAEKLAAREKAMRDAAALATAQESAAQREIRAAMERAKQQAAASRPKNIEQLTPQQQAEIDEIEKRRAHIRELAQSGVENREEKQ